MSRTLVVFGAHRCAGALLARQWGNGGYDVVLVTQQADALQGLYAVLGSEGVQARIVTAKLAAPEQVGALIESIQHSVGVIDALFYGEPEAVCEPLPSQVDPMLAAVMDQVLPAMRARRVGTVLVGAAPECFYGQADAPQCATYRYLQGLSREPANHGLHIGTLKVAALACQVRLFS